jgi:hypothetical protein
MQPVMDNSMILLYNIQETCMISIMKRTLKQWWLTIPLLSTKQTTNYLVKPLSTKGPWHMELEIHVILLWDRHTCFKYMRYKLIEQKHSTSIIILIVSNQYLRPTILFCKICDLLKWTTPNLRVVIMHKIVGIKLSRYDEFLE